MKRIKRIHCFKNVKEANEWLENKGNIEDIIINSDKDNIDIFIIQKITMC